MQGIDGLIGWGPLAFSHVRYFGLQLAMAMLDALHVQHKMLQTDVCSTDQCLSTLSLSVLHQLLHALPWVGLYRARAFNTSGPQNALLCQINKYWSPAIFFFVDEQNNSVSHAFRPLGPISPIGGCKISSDQKLLWDLEDQSEIQCQIAMRFKMILRHGNVYMETLATQRSSAA